jgi:hypothetical protein
MAYTIEEDDASWAEITRTCPPHIYRNPTYEDRPERGAVRRYCITTCIRCGKRREAFLEVVRGTTDQPASLRR